MDPSTIGTARRQRLDWSGWRWLVGGLGVFAILGAGFVLWVSYQFGHDAPGSLDALKRDPMSSYVPPGATEIDRYEDSPGFSLGMPSSGGVHRTMTVPRRDARRAFEAVLAAATRSGWSLDDQEGHDPIPPTIAHASGTRADLTDNVQYTTFRATLSADTYDDTPLPPGTVELRVDVEARAIG